MKTAGHTPIRRAMAATISAGILLFCGLSIDSVHAAEVVQVMPGTSGVEVLTRFDELAAGNYDGIVVSGGMGFAERFVGQIRTTQATFDVLSGSPSSPLLLQTGAANENIFVGASTRALCSPAGVR